MSQGQGAVVWLGHSSVRVDEGSRGEPELRNLTVNLGHPPLEKLLRMVAWAYAAVSDLHQFLDVSELQSQGLGAADKMKSLDRGLFVLPVAGVRSRGLRPQPLLFVVADRVRGNPRPACQF